MGHSRPLLLYFRLFNTQLTVNKCSIIFCQWLDWNRGPLVSEATALPTEPHNHCPIWIFQKLNVDSSVMLYFFFWSKYPDQERRVYFISKLGKIKFCLKLKGSGNEKDEDEGEEKRSRKKFNRFLTRRTSLTKSTIFEIIFHLFKNEIFLLNENEKNGKIGFQCPTFYRGNRNIVDFILITFFSPSLTPLIPPSCLWANVCVSI